MAIKAHTAVIGGEKYTIRRVDPFDGLRLATMCSRSFGPLVSAIATSPGIKELAKALAAGAVQSEEGKAAGLEKLLDMDITAVAAVLGVTIEQVGESLGDEDLVRIVRLAVIGHVSTPAGGAPMLDLDDEGTYFDVMAPRIAKHSMAHQLHLVWEVVRLNLGPTLAGDTTSLPEASPAQP